MKNKNSGTMKILKKIKKSMSSFPLPNGLRKQMSCNGSACCQGPLRFHPTTHGENVRISNSGSVARRVDSFCKGIAFGSRPVAVDEFVLLRFAEVSTTWSGVLRFGFTSQNPSLHRGTLPKYACPDLTNRPGYWAKAITDKVVKKDSVLFYYVTEKGNVHYGIDDQEKGVFFSGVDTKKPLWPLIDIYGNTTAVQLLEPVKQISVVNEKTVVKDDCSTSKYYNNSRMTPMPFHRVHGKNIRMSNDRLTVARERCEYSQGYVFTQRPLKAGEQMVVKVLENVDEYYGALSFGLTSCDPSRLRPDQLPDDCDQLLDREEYWVAVKDVGLVPQPGDELGFLLTNEGEILLSKNNGPLVPLLHVDHTLKLWAYFDVYGATQKIRSLGCSLELPEEVAESKVNDDDIECMICCEKQVNCVLYTCGHMCMCYECAELHLKKPNGNFCPICRAKVKDIIRIYRS